MVIGATASNGAACRRVGRGGDAVACQRKVGRQIVVVGNGETVCSVAGDLGVVLSPVGKGVAAVSRWRGSERAGGAVRVGAAAG